MSIKLAGNFATQRFGRASVYAKLKLDPVQRFGVIRAKKWAEINLATENATPDANMFTWLSVGDAVKCSCEVH